ncbi:MAG TPA: hypothetical protein VJ998_05620 [Pseudomonadales bacterium]|nr:hypothetical protein [Pseudomonadales bacterium]
MGVTAVVLPSCSISVATAWHTGERLPVQMRCTRQTDYNLSISSSAGAGQGSPAVLNINF